MLSIYFLICLFVFMLLESIVWILGALSAAPRMFHRDHDQGLRNAEDW